LTALCTSSLKTSRFGEITVGDEELKKGKIHKMQRNPFLCTNSYTLHNIQRSIFLIIVIRYVAQEPLADLSLHGASLKLEIRDLKLLKVENKFRLEIFRLNGSVRGSTA